jgi:hypothetical protein
MFHLAILQLECGAIGLDKDKSRQFMNRDKGNDKNAEQ